MANLSLFGKSFTERTPEEQLMLVKSARNLRRQRLPEKVRKAPVAKKKTTTKKQKLTQQSLFKSLSTEEQIKFIEDALAKKREALK